MASYNVIVVTPGSRNTQYTVNATSAQDASNKAKKLLRAEVRVRPKAKVEVLSVQRLKENPTKKTYGVYLTDQHTVFHQSSSKASAQKALKLARRLGYRAELTTSEKKNPTMPKGKFFKVEAARVNRDGSVTLKVPDSVVKRNPALRRNIAGGMMTTTGFHPFRSSPDYDPDRAGDEYGARTDNKGFTRVRKGMAKKKAAPKRKAAPKKKAKAKTKKRR